MIVTRCILSCQAVWARCWWAPVSRWPRLHLRAQHHPEEQITLSQAVVSLTHVRQTELTKTNIISDVSTIPQSTSSGSEDQSSSVNILALFQLWSYLFCPVHFWHETRLTEFVTIFCKSKIMKRQWWSRRTFWDINPIDVRCPSAECSVPWQPPNTERLPNKFLVILN